MTNQADLSQHLDLVKSIRVAHTAYERITDEIAYAFDAVGPTAVPVCELLIGESRTGKSSVVRDFLRNHLPDDEGEKRTQTVVYAVTPVNASIKDLAGSLLHGLGDPYWHRGTLEDRTNRLHTLLDKVGCRMIVLDEFQHLCDKGQRSRLYMASDWLKTFLEDNKRGLIAVGLPTAIAVVENNPQLKLRFSNYLEMPLFDWSDKSSMKQYRAILATFQNELTPFELPLLCTGEMALRMYLATAGRVGLIAKLLDRAVQDAIRHGTMKIRIEDLATAYDRAVWGANHFPLEGGPFLAPLAGLAAECVRTQVLQTAAQEGVADTSGAVKLYKRGSSEVAATDAAPRSKAHRMRSTASGAAAAAQSATAKLTKGQLARKLKVAF